MHLIIRQLVRLRPSIRYYLSSYFEPGESVLHFLLIQLLPQNIATCFAKPVDDGEYGKTALPNRYNVVIFSKIIRIEKIDCLSVKINFHLCSMYCYKAEKLEERSDRIKMS